MDYLNPAEIFYSQDSINNRFRNGHRNTYIGDTLDDLISGTLKVNNIDPMNVTQIPGSKKWVSLDNRRLWVIHHYASKRNCGRIRVKKVSYESLGYSDLRKFTADNKAGVSVEVRNGSPGGTWHNRITLLTPRCAEPEVVKEVTMAILPSQNTVSAPATEQLNTNVVTTNDTHQKHDTWKQIFENLSKTTNTVSDNKKASAIDFTPINVTLCKRGEGNPNGIIHEEEGKPNGILHAIHEMHEKQQTFNSIMGINQVAAAGRNIDQVNGIKVEQSESALQMILRNAWRRNNVMERLISIEQAVKNCTNNDTRTMNRKNNEKLLLSRTMCSLLKPFCNTSTRRYRNELYLDRSLLGKRKAIRTGLFRVRSEDEPILKRMRPAWMSRAHNGYVDVYLKPPAYHYAYNIFVFENRRTRVLRVQYFDGNPLYWFDMETGRLDYFENMKPDDWISSDEDDKSTDDIYEESDVESDFIESENGEIIDDNLDDSDSKEIDYGDIEDEFDLNENSGTEESDYEDMPKVYNLKNDSENNAREDELDKDSNVSVDSEIEDEDDTDYNVSDDSEIEDEDEDPIKVEYEIKDGDESEAEEELVYGLEYNWSYEDPEYLADGKTVKLSDIDVDVNDIDEAESTDGSDKEIDEDSTEEETQDETEDETWDDF